MEGWIKIHRSIVDWEWYGIPGMVSLWVHILVDANWEDRKWRGITIPRGSFVTSISKLASESGLSQKQTRICLERLKRTNEVAIKTTNKYTMLTVCKYDDYQVEEDTKGQTKGQAERQTKGKQRATTKEVKNIIISGSNTNAPARACETWTFISSVRRTVLGNNPDRIAEFKKDLFREEAGQIAPELGMTEKQLDAFVRWWGEHTIGSDMIRANYETVFDMRSRMQNWIERDNRPKPAPSAVSAQKSRMDTLEEDMTYIHEFFNGQQQEHTTPDEQ